MKNKYKILLFTLPIALLFGCTDEDKNPFPLDVLEQAAVLRTISFTSPAIINKSDPGSSDLVIEIEADDFQNNTRFESVDVFISFIDTFIDRENETETTLDDEDVSAAEVLVGNITASEFTAGGADGKPQYTLTINGTQAIDLLGLDSKFPQVDGGDIFRVRLAMKLNDGSVFSSDNVNGNVTGQFFSSGFRYDANVVCILATPPTGDWIIAGQDNFGDGWNGASITINIDGEEAGEFMVSAAQETENEETFTIPADAQSLTFVFNGGSFDEEISFQITAPSGNVVANVEPSPSIGEINLNLCNE